MLYDYDEDEQSRNSTENPKGYPLTLKQNDTVSIPTTWLRLIQQLQDSGPSELHSLIFLEVLLVRVFACVSTADVYHPGRNAAITVGTIAGILLVVMLFTLFPGPSIGIAFSPLWGLSGYAFGSLFTHGIGLVNSMIIGGVAALIGFNVSLKAHLSQS